MKVCGKKTVSSITMQDIIDAEMKEYDAFRFRPVTVETLEERRRFIAERILRLHEIWAEELRKYLYPHKKIELVFSILADNFPERARVLFPKVVPERDINTRVFSAGS